MSLHHCTSRTPEQSLGSGALHYINFAVVNEDKTPHRNRLVALEQKVLQTEAQLITC